MSDPVTRVFDTMCPAVPLVDVGALSPFSTWAPIGYDKAGSRRCSYITVVIPYDFDVKDLSHLPLRERIYQAL